MHYDAFERSIPEISGYTDREKIDSINKSLSEFNGKIISIRGYRQDSIGISGIEFETPEDLIFFKLKFN
jgi:hypothetical protein